MKVGYFNNTNIAPSETFVYDLLKGLFNTKNLELIYFSGSKDKLNIDFDLKYYNTGFKDGSFFLKLVTKIQFKFPRIFKLKSLLEKYFIRYTLNKFSAQNIDVAYIEYATNGVLLMDYFNKRNIPIVVHIHGYDVTTKMNDLYYKNEFKRLCSIVDTFIVASNFMKRILILNGCDENKIQMIRLGIDTLSINPISWDERKKSAPSIIFLGRLTQKKHPLALLQAFYLVQKEIPNCKLTIIGDGPLKKEIVERIDSLKLIKNVVMLGSLSREDAFPILNSHWIYAQHSVTSSVGDQEGFAISLAEASAHELPVVSTIHNGITENVIDGITGFLVPEFDYELMAEKIIYLIQHTDVCERMGKQGRQQISDLCKTEKRISDIKIILDKAYENSIKKKSNREILKKQNVIN